MQRRAETDKGLSALSFLDTGVTLDEKTLTVDRADIISRLSP
jgi:hypothetical protein